MSSDKVNNLKAQGNAALAVGKYEVAVRLYTEAIQINETNHVLYSNRSAAYAKMNNGEESLRDAQKCIELEPNFVKGYSRKGAALRLLNRRSEAIEAYEQGLKFDANNENLKKELEEVRSAEQGREKEPLFDSQMMSRLLMNPKARALLEDQETMKAFSRIQSGNFDVEAIQNPKIMELLGLTLGINSEDDLPKSPEAAGKQTAGSAKHSPPSKADVKEHQKPEPAKEVSEADKEKQLGNEFYKKKQFDEAISHYDKAIELDPTNMTYLTNKAAVYYERNEFEECRKLCEEAIEIGRENKADFALVAKAFARIGNSYLQEENYEMAQKYFEHSLAEDRNMDIVKKKEKVVKLLKEQERKRLIDPEKAEQEKNAGNELFQKGDYPEALKHYNMAITRNPDDVRYYSNRAACYAKLMEFELAIRDCDECIKRDPKFIKAYLRKGSALQGMQQYSRAVDAFNKALELDSTCQEAWEGRRFCDSKASNDPEEVKRRAMSDPEIREILADPAMRLILEQMQEDPTALREHMKNEHIRGRIQKLIDAGVIGIRHA